MKKRLLALALVVITLFMTACGGPAYMPGNFTADGYESEFLGFRFTTPDGFTLATRDQLNQMMGLATDLLGDDINETQKQYMELTVVYELMVSDEQGTANANITIENTKLSEGVYLEAMKQQLAGLTSMKVELNDNVEKVELAGNTYNKLTAVVTMDGVTLNQDYYIRKVGDRMMGMTVSWANGFEDGRDAIINGFAAY